MWSNLSRMLSLSLHLVTWNGAKYLPHLFASLREQTVQEWNLVVVDNGSQDTTVAVLEGELAHFRTKMRKEIRVVRNTENRGFVGGHNQAFQCSMQNAKCSIDGYVQLLNQDTVLAPDYVEKLVAFLDAHPDAAAVQGALCRWDFVRNARTDVIDSLGLRVLRTRQVVEVGAGDRWDAFDLHGRDPTPRPLDALRMTQGMEVFGVSGALPMYRGAALADVALPIQRPSPSRFSPRGKGEERIEIFDSSFFSYKEDVDLAYRLRSAGWKAYCVPDARAWHDRTAGAYRTRAQRSACERQLSWRNHLLMVIANEHWRTFVRDWWRILGYELGKFAYLLTHELRTLGAFPALLRGFPHAMRKRSVVMERYHAKPEEVGKWFDA